MDNSNFGTEKWTKKRGFFGILIMVSNVELKVKFSSSLDADRINLRNTKHLLLVSKSN